MPSLSNIIFSIALFTLCLASFIFIPYRNWQFYTDRVKSSDHPQSAALPLSELLFKLLFFAIAFYIYIIATSLECRLGQECALVFFLIVPIGIFYGLAELLFQKGIKSS